MLCRVTLLSARSRRNRNLFFFFFRSSYWKITGGYVRGGRYMNGEVRMNFYHNATASIGSYLSRWQLYDRFFFFFFKCWCGQSRGMSRRCDFTLRDFFNGEWQLALLLMSIYYFCKRKKKKKCKEFDALIASSAYGRFNATRWLEWLLFYEFLFFGERTP